MKPRWHAIRIKRHGFSKPVGWARPIDRPGFILLFDGQRKEIVSLEDCERMEKAKELRWLHCEALKRHQELEDQYRAVKKGPIFPVGWDQRGSVPVPPLEPNQERAEAQPLEQLKSYSRERRVPVTNS